MVLTGRPADPKTYKGCPQLTTTWKFGILFKSTGHPNLLLHIYNLFNLYHNEVGTPFRVLASCNCGICCQCSFRSSTMSWSCSVWWSLHYTEQRFPRWCKSIFVAYCNRYEMLMAADRMWRSKPTSPAPSALEFDPISQITLLRYLSTTTDMNPLSSLPAVSLPSRQIRLSTNSKFRWVCYIFLVDSHSNHTFQIPFAPFVADANYTVNLANTYPINGTNGSPVLIVGVVETVIKINTSWWKETVIRCLSFIFRTAHSIYRFISNILVSFGHCHWTQYVYTLELVTINNR